MTNNQDDRVLWTILCTRCKYQRRSKEDRKKETSAHRSDGLNVRVVGRSSALTLRRQRSWKHDVFSASIALQPPVPLGQLPKGCKAGTPSVPCPRKGRNFEADICGRQATIAPCQRPALDPRCHRVGF